MGRRHGDPARVGRVRKITSLANPVVKGIKALHRKKARDATGGFLAEGAKLVADAIGLGWRVETLVHAETAGGAPMVERLAAHTVASGGLVVEVSGKIMEAIVRRDNPQMVCAVLAQRYKPLREVHPGKDETWIALDRIRDPGNLGTIIRTADAAGASGVILIGDCTDPFSLEAVRATMGSIFAVPVAETTVHAFAGWRVENTCQCVATHLAGSVDYRQVDFRACPTILMMGNEQQGLCETLARAADVRVRIPQTGRADSLNLAVATGIMLYEARRHLLELQV